MNLETYVIFIKKWEGGLSGDPSDSCSSMYCPTLFKGKMYHTNMGICYSTWVGTFGTTNDQRFLNMKLGEWLRLWRAVSLGRSSLPYVEACLLQGLLPGPIR